MIFSPMIFGLWAKNDTEEVDFLVDWLMIGTDTTNGDDFFEVAFYDADCPVGEKFSDLVGTFGRRWQLALTLAFSRRCHEEDPIVDFVVMFNVFFVFFGAVLGCLSSMALFD